MSWLVAGEAAACGLCEWLGAEFGALAGRRESEGAAAAPSCPTLLGWVAEPQQAIRVLRDTWITGLPPDCGAGETARTEKGPGTFSRRRLFRWRYAIYEGHREWRPGRSVEAPTVGRGVWQRDHRAATVLLARRERAWPADRSERREYHLRSRGEHRGRPCRCLRRGDALPTRSGECHLRVHRHTEERQCRPADLDSLPGRAVRRQLLVTVPATQRQGVRPSLGRPGGWGR